MVQCVTVTSGLTKGIVLSENSKQPDIDQALLGTAGLPVSQRRPSRSNSYQQVTKEGLREELPQEEAESPPSASTPSCLGSWEE